MKHARIDYERIQDPSGKIPEDEPVFLLRGQDRAAPAAVEHWARIAERQGAHHEIVAAARRQAQLMREYQGSCCNKVADMPGHEPVRKPFKPELYKSKA